MLSQNRIPLVVGGTGFYIDALFHGIAPIEIPEEVLAKAAEQARQDIEREGFDVMHERLRTIDPELYVQIQRERNPIRLERAWGHYYASREPLGKTRKRIPEPFEYSPMYNVQSVPRPELWQRIETRTEQMIANGWMDEVEKLMAKGVTRSMPAMRAIGYNEMFDVVEGKRSMEDAQDKINIRTRQYAKRQVTWMKKYA